MRRDRNEQAGAMIRLRRVTKRFGQDVALADVSASFAQGQIHGLIGRNGTGKTVLMKCIAGLMPPTSGKIIVDGKWIGKEIEMPQSLGAIIETPGFLPNYSGYQNLKFLADIRGQIGEKQIRAAMKRVGLEDVGGKWVANYSLGMRQRLGIAQAIMEDPDLLILDEPMNGLDNQGVREMRKLFNRLRSEGKTILLATHNPYDVDELCDTVHEMDAGVLEMLE